MSQSEVKNVALVGATGSVGGQALPHLLSTFGTVTVLTRPSSDVSTLPKSEKLIVKRADSNHHAALLEALKDVDALIITQAIMVPMSVQLALVDAAVEAGVKWILPNDYGSDTQHAPLTSQVPMMAEKAQPADLVVKRAAELNKPAKFIRLITNPWYEYGLPHGMWGINLADKKASFYGEGNSKGYSTTVSNVGLAMARLLALPSAELGKYGNSWCYIADFKFSQRDILDSVQRVTGTTDKDWTIEHLDADAEIKKGLEVMNQGGFHPAPIYGSAFQEGLGGLYCDRELANEKLGLPKMDLDTFTKQGLGI